MDDRLLLIVLRLFHILGGVFWAGSMLVVAGFLLPAASASPEGGRTLQRVMMQQRLSAWLSAAAGVTVVSGLWMYAKFSMASDGAWARSRPGMALAFGGLLAIVAGALAGAISVPTGRRIGELGARMQQKGGAPSSEDGAEMKRLLGRAGATTRLIASLLVLTAASMAVARYL